MSNEDYKQLVTLAYWDEPFRFGVQNRTEDRLIGRFLWTDSEKKLLQAMCDREDEEGIQPWYLDEDGFRLDDDELFQKSPWSLIDAETCGKAIQRFMNWESGEATFCLTPWFRIGDELNRRK